MNARQDLPIRQERWSAVQPTRVCGSPPFLGMLNEWKWIPCSFSFLSMSSYQLTYCLRSRNTVGLFGCPIWLSKPQHQKLEAPQSDYRLLRSGFVLVRGRRRDEGRKAQEATTRQVKMIGATSVSTPSPTAMSEATAPVMMKNMPA